MPKSLSLALLRARLVGYFASVSRPLVCVGLVTYNHAVARACICVCIHVRDRVPTRTRTMWRSLSGRDKGALLMGQDISMEMITFLGHAIPGIDNA